MSELTQEMCDLLKREREALLESRLHERVILRSTRADLMARASQEEIEGYNRWLDALESTSAQAA